MIVGNQLAYVSMWFSHALILRAVWFGAPECVFPFVGAMLHADGKGQRRRTVYLRDRGLHPFDVA